MVSVRLIAFTLPMVGRPVNIPYLAKKISTGKLNKPDRNVFGYLLETSDDKVYKVLLEACENYPSILEHVSFTFLVEGISRVCSHQLVRHRLASYTQESQRYSEDLILSLCPAKDLEDALACYREVLKSLDEMDATDLYGYLGRIFVIPETIAVTYDTNGGFHRLREFARTVLRSLITYIKLRLNGVPMEDARFVLPQCIKTRLLVTMNLRELLHVACLRLSPRAQWEIRDVVEKMIEEAEHVFPGIRMLVNKYCKNDR